LEKESAVMMVSGYDNFDYPGGEMMMDDDDDSDDSNDEDGNDDNDDV